MTNKNFMTIYEVQKTLNKKSVSAAVYWLKKNNVPTYDWAGPGYLYKESDVAELLEPKPVEAARLDR